MNNHDYNARDSDPEEKIGPLEGRRQRLENFGLGLVKAGAILLCLVLTGATLLAFFGGLDYRIDLLANFRFQFAAGLVLALSLSQALKLRWIAVFSAVGLLVNAVLIAPLYIPTGPASQNSELIAYRLLQANVRTDNRSFNSLRLLVEKEEPDFILLLEVNQGWINELALHELGYTHETLWPLENNFGIGLFSKIAPAEQGFFQAENARFPAVYGSYNLPEGPLKIFGAHPPPPLSPGGAEARNREIRLAFYQAARHTGPRILAADFNATTWSATLAQELAGSNLRDSRRGFGLQPSWPTFIGTPFRIPIDHVFISPEIIVIDRRLGPEIGSDHLPVILEFQIQE